MNQPAAQKMTYLDLLEKAHEIVKPSRYFEIGVRKGDSLKLADCPSIGVDPAYKIAFDLPKSTQLFRKTSDDFFSEHNLPELFGGSRPDMAFIDGMHLAEFVFRDFAHTERNCTKDAIIFFDDMMPRRIEMAAREHPKGAWTGDVYRALCMIKLMRPELDIVTVRTKGQGVGIITGISPESETLHSNMDRVSKELEETDRFCVTSVEDMHTQYQEIGIRILSPTDAVAHIEKFTGK